MKTVLFILITMSIFTNSCKNNKAPEQIDNCFSEEDFEMVCQYIDKQLAETDTAFFVFEDYEVYFDSAKKEISLKKEGYTHSKISPKGIYSLNKSQKGNEKIVKKAKQLFCKLVRLSTQESNEPLIPEELKNYIDSTTVFLLAEISRDGFEPLANHLYLLDNKQVFTRVSNKTIPEEGMLFGSDIDQYQTRTDIKKHQAFMQYMESICTPELKKEYKTPENLSVNGGAFTYIYIKSKNASKWLRFEPESGAFLKEIKQEFNQIF
jgi:hypothetical protein